MNDEQLLKRCFELMRDYIHLYRVNTITDDGRSAQSDALDSLEQELIDHLIEANDRGYNLPDYNECRYKIDVRVQDAEFRSFFEQHLNGSYAGDSKTIDTKQLEWL